MSSMVHAEHTTAPVPDTGWAVGAQLLTIVTGIVGPIIVLIAQGHQNPLTRFHARQSVNLSINLFAFFMLIAFLSLIHPAFGIFFIPLFALNFWPVYGAVRAGRGDYWKYPGMIPFLRAHKA